VAVIQKGEVGSVVESIERVVFDVEAVLASLAAKRPVFHSEADFQFAFAWESQKRYPGLKVRLETHPEPNVRLDLELIEQPTGRCIAVELKYMTRLWAGTVDGEAFALKNHGASDLRGYDVVKDIERVERFTAASAGWSGLVITITNDPGYWRPKVHSHPTNAEAFRLSDGTVLKGERAWGPRTGGTSRGREAALRLRGTYALTWSDYSRLDDGPAGTFRSLVISIEGGGMGAVENETVTVQCPTETREFESGDESAGNTGRR